MATNPSDQERATDWITRRWKGGADSPCEACGHKDWVIADTVTLSVQMPMFPFGGQVSLIPVICQFCANTRFIHKLAMENIREKGQI